MNFIRDALRMLRAVRSLARLGYYNAALRHIGQTHEDSPKLARKIVLAQIEVDDFFRHMERQ